MNYKHIDFIISDAHGIIRGKQAPAQYLESYATKGFGFPRSVLGVDVWGEDTFDNGLLEHGDGDVVTKAISTEAVPVTWSKNRGQVQAMMYEPDGTPSPYDTRQRLIAVSEEFQSSTGYKPVVAFELEFYLTEQSKSTGVYKKSTRQGGANEQTAINAYDMLDLTEKSRLFDDIYAACDAQNIPADGLVSENAPSQYEINFNHIDDIVLAADYAVLFKRIVKSIALKHGYVATFMAKPFAETAGNGMHVHISLLDDKGENILAANAEDEAIGPKMAHILSGLIDTMSESTLIFAPHMNSYKRLRIGTYAPLSATWGVENRTTALRIPFVRGKAARVEHRVAGADANPYLVGIVLLKAVQKGLEAPNEIAPPHTSDGYIDESAPQIARNWFSAHEKFEASAFLVEALGPKLHFMYGRIINQEIQKMQERISDMEYDAYLRAL